MNNNLLIANCIVFWLLFAICSRKGWPNLLSKVGFLALAVLNTLAAYSLLSK